MATLSGSHSPDVADVGEPAAGTSASSAPVASKSTPMVRSPVAGFTTFGESCDLGLRKLTGRRISCAGAPPASPVMAEATAFSTRGGDPSVTAARTRPWSSADAVAGTASSRSRTSATSAASRKGRPDSTATVSAAVPKASATAYAA